MKCDYCLLVYRKGFKKWFPFRNWLHAVYCGRVTPLPPPSQKYEATAKSHISWTTHTNLSMMFAKIYMQSQHCSSDITFVLFCYNMSWWFRMWVFTHGKANPTNQRVPTSLWIWHLKLKFIRSEVCNFCITTGIKHNCKNTFLRLPIFCQKYTSVQKFGMSKIFFFIN